MYIYACAHMYVYIFIHLKDRWVDIHTSRASYGIKVGYFIHVSDPKTHLLHITQYIHATLRAGDFQHHPLTDTKLAVWVKP